MGLLLAAKDKKGAYDSEWENCANRCGVGSMEIHPQLLIRANPSSSVPSAFHFFAL